MTEPIAGHRSMKTNEHYTLCPPQSAALFRTQIDRDTMSGRRDAPLIKVNGLGWNRLRSMFGSSQFRITPESSCRGSRRHAGSLPIGSRQPMRVEILSRSARP
jgi:hypothetical protein